MKIGLGVYTGELIPEEGVTATQVYLNDLEQAKLAEEVGLDSVWYSEHHFLPNGYNPSVLSMCAATAAVTSRITIGPSVVLGPLWHPVRLAEDCGMVDRLSGGRLALGVGLGYRDEEYAGFNVNRGRRVAMTEELMQILRLAWGSEPVTFEGKEWQLNNVDIHPKPVQPGGPPILFGGYIPKAVERAARYADGFIMDGGTDSKAFGKTGKNRDLFERVSEMVAFYRSALQKEGKSFEGRTFAMTIGGFVSEKSADDAWNTVKESYMLTRRVYGSWYGLPEATYSRWYPDQMTPEEIAQRRSEIWAATPDDIAARLKRLRGIVGEGLHVMFRTKYPAVDHERTSESIRLLGQIRTAVL
jgi:alkanesulfonate monooxygenase SsuD/methylene tetrahydromethanopterin reductase-like flavin-dependent oxidoreductase (luciferase family)